MFVPIEPDDIGVKGHDLGMIEEYTAEGSGTSGVSGNGPVACCLALVAL